MKTDAEALQPRTKNSTFEGHELHGLHGILNPKEAA